MGQQTFTTSGGGQNWKGGTKNSGSHLIGWDNGSVRAETYKFTTKEWPVTKISFRTPTTSVYQGANIAMRFGISKSETTYVKSGSTTTGYAATKNGTTTLNVELEANTTYYICFFPGVARSGTWGMLNISSSNFTITADVIDYTPCIAPDFISLSRQIQTPGESVSLSWSGAMAGTNLTIGSYDIYRSTSEEGEYSLLGNTEDTSYNVEAPSAGTYYYYKIITKPAEDETGIYDSDFSIASEGLKGNTAPNAPTVSVNKTAIPSTGGAITFTVIPGSDIDDQTRSLAYSTTQDGEKIPFTSPLTISFTTGATYYFYTFDGLAYSSATSQSITVNVKPVISTFTYDSIGLYNALGGTGIENYQLGYANNITPKISSNKIGNVKVELEYYSLPSSAPGATTAWNSEGGEINRVIVQQSPISSTSNVILNNYNIHQYISLGSTNIHWRLRIVLNDGIEDSDFIYYPSASAQKYYAIARPSALLATYNQHGNSDITGTNAGQVWRNVRLKIYNDTSVPLVSTIASINDSAINATTSTSVDGQYRYIDIALPDGLSGGTTINISSQMRDSSNYVIKSVTTSVTETQTAQLDTLSHGAQVIKPFTDTGTFAISAGWPFGSYTEVSAATLSAFNCSTNASTAIKLIYSSSNNGSGTNRVEKTLTWTKSGDNISTSMNKNVAYDWNNSLGYTIYNGSRSYYCRLEITNLFGKTVSTPWLLRTFNFAEPAQSPSILSIDWSLDGNTWNALGNKAIQEGVYLRFNCSFGLFTTDEVKVSLLLNNASGERSVSSYEFGSPTRITPITYSNTELSRATNRTVANNTKSYVYKVTTEIADTRNRQWKLKIENSGYTTTSSYITTPVTRQCAPDLTLIKCEVNKNYQLTYIYTLTDNGGGTLTNYLFDGTQNLSTALPGAGGTVQSLVVDWETKTVSVKTVSVVTGLYTNTKTYYSNSIIVYQISPTVAYRKNRLGINTDEPLEDAMVDIHQSTGQTSVVIQGLDENSNPTKFEVNVTTGEIKFYLNGNLKNTIDLSKGILT